ncbi:hypothetical protein ES319_A10G037100v1 [Gossypium barbadense]|uniref:Transmembrane protein n=1 Tax=Gossypium barbadense TaxID=3634 RepID=A0A2P5WGV0_GOSBA|nr:hypothetical protein ES319_A10G037100v1 [Gossypium barbadense]PPR90306.1 hypothetical protein GOBAR_AA30373 [Gossypium barbadense]
MAAFNYILFFTSLIILFPIFMSRTVSTIRIHHELTPSKHSGDAAVVNRNNMLAADHHNVAVPPHGSHGIVIGVLKKGRITPSGPSHRGNTIPTYTRHDGVGRR